MNPFPQDDEDLVQFLRRHRSDPPAASPDLENQILESLPSIELSSQDDEVLIQFLRRHRSELPIASRSLENRIVQSLPQRGLATRSRLTVMFAAGIAASFIGVMFATPVRSPAPDAATLEAFMESNWSTTLDGGSTSEPASDYISFVEPNTNN